MGTLLHSHRNSIVLSFNLTKSLALTLSIENDYIYISFPSSALPHLSNKVREVPPAYEADARRVPLARHPRQPRLRCQLPDLGLEQAAWGSGRGC